MPASTTFSCAFDAFDRITSVPDTGPDAAGENTTLKVRLCPAASVAGSDSPWVMNAELERLVPEMATLALPTLVRLSIRVCELPGRILPKLKLVGEAASWLVAVIPVPERAAVADVIVLLYFHLLEPLLLGMDALTATDPPSVPGVNGAKVTLTYKLCPGGRVYGRLGPLTA